MRVTLKSHTPDALNLLLSTKETRLATDPTADQIESWSEERKRDHLRYMLGTIQSSWEFVDYTFLIEGVTRAFTHQLVRTREGSYAQQAQRAVDMSAFEYVTTGPMADIDGRGYESLDAERMEEQSRYRGRLMEEEDNPVNVYDTVMGYISIGYKRLVQLGVPRQDARGVLPTNVSTNIMAKFNLRTLHNMGKLRLCTRVQGEYQTVFRAMREAVIEVHPWTDEFIRVHCASVGTCQFPNFKECPVKGVVFNADTGRRWDEDDTKRPATKEEIQQLWQITRYEARPDVTGDSRT